MEQFREGAEKVGFNVSASAKILEYIERTNKALGERARGNSKSEDPDTLKASMKQFGKIDFDELREFAKDYKMPATFEYISANAKPNYQELTRFALATRAVPETGRYRLDPKKIGAMNIGIINGEPRIIFNEVPGLAFSADKLLAACLTSKDKKSFYYPHFNLGSELVSTSVFETSPHQFYMVERMAREVLAKRGDLRKLYPDKEITTEFGRTTMAQNPDATVIVTHQGSGQSFHTEDGLLGFPLNEASNLDILRGTKFYAAYNHETKAMLVGEQFLEHLSHPGEILPNGVRALDIAEITARHELNHAFWDNVSAAEKKQILDCFQQSEPKFNHFVNLFAANENYRNGAVVDLQRNPNAEFVTVTVNGQQFKMGKERVVNEMIAYATWTEIVGQDVMDKINAPDTNGKPKNLLMPVATECTDSLNEIQKNLLKRKLLSMEKGSKTYKDFFEPFIIGAKILAINKSK